MRGREEALIQKERLFDFLGGLEGRLLDRECLFEEIGYLVKPSTKKLKRIKLISVVSQSVSRLPCRKAR